MTTDTDINLEITIGETEKLEAQARANLREADELLFRSIENGLPFAHTQKIIQKQREAHEILTRARSALESLRGIRTWDPSQVQ